MKSLQRLVGAVVGAAALSIAAAGVAHAGGPTDTTGEYYRDASQALSGEGYTVVVAGRSGDEVDRDSCLVAHQQVFTVKKGTDDRGPTVHLTLRCYKAEVAAKEAADKAKAQAGG